MSNLSFLAGSKAFAKIQRDGLAADDVKVIAGAAGGPKWLILSQIDRILFGSFFQNRQDSLFLLGASIGAWRFAAASQKDPLHSISKFEEAYINQRYSAQPSPSEVTRTSYQVMDGMLSASGLQEILQHPYLRLNILAVRSHWPTASDHPVALKLGLGAAALSNIFSPKALDLFFRRTLFSDSRSRAPFYQAAGFDADHVALNQQNLRNTLMASGSIPLVMSGIKDIEDAPRGLYRDGGIVDYHLDLPFLPPDDEGIVLFPHFEERIIPGWFDKWLRWRKPSAEHMAQVLLVAPSQDFINRLPLKKIPDRKDFAHFQGRDEERIQYWRTVIHECQSLADELQETLSQGTLAQKLRVLPTRN